MFKNRSMQIKMVKDQPVDKTEALLNIEPETINTIVKNSVKTIGIGIVAVAGSLTVLNTLSEIAINASPKK